MKIKNMMRRLGGVVAGLALLPAMAWADSTALAGLEVRGASRQNLVAGFNGGITEYDVQLDGPENVTLSAVPQSKTAVVDFLVNDEQFDNHSVAPLVVGANTITCRVTDGPESRTYTVKLQAEQPHRTIYFKSGWSAQPYVYIYTESPKNEFAGTWPGTTMRKHDSTWYTYTLDDEAGKDAMVIFNTGKGGADRYPADQQPGVKLDFEGYEGWYVLDEHKFYTSNPDGPRKPEITVSPAGGKVKGTRQIQITFSYEPTEVSGTFAGKTISGLTTSGATVTVSDYLADGAEGTLSVTATNPQGTATFTGTYTRDDSTPVVTLTGDSRELSIYQVMVGSFQHGEGGASGYSDMWGPVGHRKNGNLRGIINSLDYIQELGMNAIWMTPIFDSTNGSGGEKLQATGYFANDYFNIDPKFGTKDEFRELVTEAHNRGMYIILDGVFGHHGGTPAASPSGKTIDNRTAQNVRGTDSGNIAYPGSLDFFKEVLRYWMEEYEVDGWRLDQCYQVYQGGHNYWADLRQEVEAVCNERKARGEQWGTLGYMVGEDWTGASSITVTRQDGLKSVMDFDGKDNLVGLRDGVGSIGWFLSNDAAARGYKDAGVNPTIFLSNHDTARVGDNTACDINTESGVKQLMTRHAAVACYNGPAINYYGDEIGDKSGNGNADNKARTSGRLTGFNANEQRLHDYVAQVFNIRKNNPAMWRGTVDRQQSTGYEVITKTDAETGNKVVIVFSDADRNVSIGGTGTDLINGGTVNGTVSVKGWVPAFILMD